MRINNLVLQFGLTVLLIVLAIYIYIYIYIIVISLLLSSGSGWRFSSVFGPAGLVC